MKRTVRFYLALLLALMPFSAQAAQTGKKRVIISTDLALGLQGGWRSMNDADDGWAVPMALADPSLDVKLVATVFGNSNVAAEEVVSKLLIRDLLGSRVKRARGASLKLDDPQAKLNGKPLTRGCWNDGVEAMSQVLTLGHATIVAIGPLTDVGCLVLNAPAALVKNIDEVVAVMGRAPGEAFSIGSVSGLTDFNAVMDNRALEVLLNQSQVPMTFLEFRLTREVLVTREFITKLKDGTPLQRFIYDGTIAWVDFWQKSFAEDGFHPWDSNAVWYTAEPAAFSCTDVNFRIQSCAKDSTDPYNRLGGCAGHSADQNPSLDREAIQLWLADGVAPSRKVKACTGYRSKEDRERFELAVRAFLGVR